jgi:NTP pyrophosphatase (non-canonical NTP hydrolase)
MVDSKYLQNGFDLRLSHLIEECGEVVHAAAKLQRWGPHSVNPKRPKGKTNLEWLKSEINDLVLAVGRLEESIVEEFE